MNNFEGDHLVQFNNRQAEMLQRLIRNVYHLSREKNMRYDDIYDTEESHMLNLQALKIMLQSSEAGGKIIDIVNMNIRMLTYIREERRVKQAALAELLIHDQVYTYYYIFFHERMRTAEDHIEEQRKLIHQKYYYFGNVTYQLNSYEEPPEEDNPVSIMNLYYVLLYQKDKKLLARLSRETEELRRTSKNSTQYLKTMKNRFRNSVEMILFGQDYQKVLTTITEKDDLRSEGHEKTEWYAVVNLDRYRVMPPLRNAHRYLLQILKKYKRSRMIMQEEIKYSITIGSEIRNRMEKLKKTNSNLYRQVEDYKMKITNLYKKLKEFTSGRKQQPDDPYDLVDKAEKSEDYFRMGERREIDTAPPEVLMIKCSSEPECGSRYWAEEYKSTID